MLALPRTVGPPLYFVQPAQHRGAVVVILGVGNEPPAEVTKCTKVPRKEIKVPFLFLLTLLRTYPIIVSFRYRVAK